MSTLFRSILSLCLLSPGCEGTLPTRIASTDVEVRRVDERARWVFGMTRAPTPGDWILRSRLLRATVLGTSSARRDAPIGSISQVIDLEHPETEDFHGVELTVRVQGLDAPLQHPTFSAVLVHGEPALRLSARVQAGAALVDVIRDYSLESGRNALHVVSRLHNVSTVTSAAISAGAHLRWGSSTPFAPGFGTVTGAVTGAAPWVGAVHRSSVIGWTSPRGDLPLTFSEDLHETVRTASFTDVEAPAEPLSPGQWRTERAMLFVLQGDLATLARAAMTVREEPTVEVLYNVRGAGQEPSSVTVRDTAGRVQLVASPGDAPMPTLPLPPGRYVAVATAPGHTPGEAVSFTARGGAGPVVMEIPRGGHIRVQARDAVSERDLPVRVTLRGIDGTRDPDLGPVHHGAGARWVAVVPSGRAEIPVPPGRYRVIVSHGPEWTLSSSEVQVTERLRGEVTARLQHIVPMDGWVSCDLHVHANPSYDSQVTVDDRVASLVAEGVDFATPTEHNVVGDYGAGVAALPDSIRETLAWVHAVEVTTDSSAQPWGHFNIYPYVPDPNVPGGGVPPFRNTPPRMIFRAARANNPDAIIQVNHPRMQTNIGYFSVSGLDVRTNRAVSPEYDPNYDAIEVFNGFYVSNIPMVESVMRDWFALLDTGARYVATGSSDSHAIMFQWAGYPRTYVRLDAPAGTAGIDTAALLRSLRDGHAFVTSGPMLLLEANGRGPGDTVLLRERADVTFRVRVLAAPWIGLSRIEFFRSGERVAVLEPTQTESVLRLDTTVTLPMQPGQWVVASARGVGGELAPVLPNVQGASFAFTNPIFFDRVAPTPRTR